jgi:hypothetical protein
MELVHAEFGGGSDILQKYLDPCFKPEVKKNVFVAKDLQIKSYWDSR